jgi:hypothetical protein
LKLLRLEVGGDDEEHEHGERDDDQQPPHNDVWQTSTPTKTNLVIRKPDTSQPFPRESGRHMTPWANRRRTTSPAHRKSLSPARRQAGWLSTKARSVTATRAAIFTKNLPSRVSDQSPRRSVVDSAERAVWGIWGGRSRRSGRGAVRRRLLPRPTKSRKTRSDRRC